MKAFVAFLFILVSVPAMADRYKCEILRANSSRVQRITTLRVDTSMRLPRKAVINAEKDYVQCGGIGSSNPSLYCGFVSAGGVLQVVVRDGVTIGLVKDSRTESLMPAPIAVIPSGSPAMTLAIPDSGSRWMYNAVCSPGMN